MTLDNALADSESQTRAALARTAWKPVKRREYGFELIWRNADTVVSHIYDYIRRPWSNCDAHLGTVRAKLDGISQEI
jgi:hypothetical protein